MFIELNRVYLNNPYTHSMLLKIDTILKVEPIDYSEDKVGNTRIVLDRKDLNGEFIVMYFADTYGSVTHRIKAYFNPPNRRKK